MNKIISRRLKCLAGGIIFLSGLLASGCGRKKDVLNENQMVDLIVDLKLAEAYSNSQMVGSNRMEERERLSESVLSEHGVTRQQLDSTLGWYGRNLDKYAQLYEKVDKRMLEKRKKLLSEDESGVTLTEDNNIWPYGKNGMITQFGNTDGWVLSIPEPELSPGDRLEWTLHLKNTSVPLTGILGVEYEDGTSAGTSSQFTGRSNITLEFQTDTAKIVTRLYGSMRLKKNDTSFLYADSISLRRFPFDSLEYVKYRSQRKYGFPVRNTAEDRARKAKADSIRRDSIQNAAKLKRDSIDEANKITKNIKETKDKSEIDKSLTPKPVIRKGEKPIRPQKKPLRPGESS